MHNAEGATADKRQGHHTCADLPAPCFGKLVPHSINLSFKGTLFHQTAVRTLRFSHFNYAVCSPWECPFITIQNLGKGQWS